MLVTYLVFFYESFMICAWHAATDDAQKMMQMGGGFGFNPAMVLCPLPSLPP